MERAYWVFLVSLAIILLLLLIFAIIKSIIGPKVADRIVSINMLSTIVVMILCTMTVLFKTEGYLADISILYVLISFVTIIVLANVFIRVNMRKKFLNDSKKKEED